MDVLRTAVSFFGAEDPAEDDGSPTANRTKSLALLAKPPAGPPTSPNNWPTTP